MKLAQVILKKNQSKLYREQIAVWLHEKAEEIKTMKDGDYILNPKWSFHDNEG